MQNKRILGVALAAFVSGTFLGTSLDFVSAGTAVTGSKSKGEIFREYYDAEVAVSVSPHGLRRKIEQGQFKGILVDVRSAEEYAEEHIVGAVNIPAYKDRYTPDYEAVDRIVSAFKALPEGKEVVVYCYSRACMSGRKVGQMLAQNGIYVKHLGIGWNEFRYEWRSWNHRHEWETSRPEDYVVSGSEPGVFKGPHGGSSTCSEGKFSC